MLLMHVYTLRKRAKRAVWLGPPRYWLDIHVYLGLMGPLFILLHTSFKIQGLVAVSFWCMVGVALSGIFGRYLYQQIPRNINGGLLSLRELGEQCESILRRVGTDKVLTEIVAAYMDRLTLPATLENEGLLKALWVIVRDDLRRPFAHRRHKAQLTRLVNVSQSDRNRLADLILDRALVQRRLLLLEQAQKMFHYWHVIHKPFAIIMYLITAVHISIAIWTGYGLIK